MIILKKREVKISWIFDILKNYRRKKCQNNRQAIATYVISGCFILKELSEMVKYTSIDSQAI